MTQVVAEAFLDGSLAADAVIQNAGGVRTPLAAGDITLDTAFTLLPFPNVLIELHMRGAEVAQALEDAVAHYMDEGASAGSHPYGAGLRWNLDLSKPRGKRFSDIEVRDRITGLWHPIDPRKAYVIAANDYIASGKSGYKTFAQVSARGDALNNYLLYAQTFVDYVSRLQNLQRPPRCAYSHKRVIAPNGSALADAYSPDGESEARRVCASPPHRAENTR